LHANPRVKVAFAGAVVFKVIPGPELLDDKAFLGIVRSLVRRLLGRWVWRRRRCGRLSDSEEGGPGQKSE
jgi:hypothetical protein